MNKELEEAISRLNKFKTIKVLYENTFAMHIEQLQQLQSDLEKTLNYIDNSISKEEIEKKIEECKKRLPDKIDIQSLNNGVLAKATMYELAIEIYKELLKQK